jgi:hypothetical protein
MESKYGGSSRVKLPYDPAMPLLGIHQKECKSGYNKGTYTLMVSYSIIHISHAMETAKLLPC